MIIAVHSPEGEQRKAVLSAELRTQTDRGAAIVAAAWLDDSMSFALNKYFKQHAESWKRLFEGSGPLATFSAKIDLSRLVGLITNGVRSDLHMIRDVRNEFAHHVAHRTAHEQLSFETPHIRDKCSALRSVVGDTQTLTSREKYISVCLSLSWDFDTASDLLGWSIPHDGIIFIPSERHGA